MIEIIEDESKKLPCISSLFVKINYNPELFSILRQSPDSEYDDKTKVFEFSTNKLFFLITVMTEYDDVKYLPLKAHKVPQEAHYDLTFKVKPYSYQMEGIEYGLNHNNWLLLDDQGLGKTLQMIYLAESLKKLRGIKHCLVICGINSLKFNWIDEIKKFSDLDYRILGQYTTKNGKIRIKSVTERCNELLQPIDEFFVITNKETLQSGLFIKNFRKNKNSFDMIVVDECHKLKNKSSQAAATLLKLKAPYKIALTGTIIMNNPENAFVPLKWTENTNSTLTSFKKLYNVYGGFGGVQVIGYKNLNLLQDLISSCSLRRLKDEVLDLPDKSYVKEYVELFPSQRELYDDMYDNISAELDLIANSNHNIIQELSKTVRLRQITEYPGIVSSSVTQSAKLDRTEELVENIVAQGDKVLIYTSFKATADELCGRLSEYNPVCCTGDTKDEEVSKNKVKFNSDDSCKVMVATWQKMGTGHTLTAASYVIFVSTPFTNADFEQAADRIYRIGQNKHCFIITIITKDTYDERVQEIIDLKEDLSGYLVDKHEIKKINIFSE